MAISECEDPVVSAAVDRYVYSQKKSGRPISTREAVQALRSVLVKCYLSDRRLADLVAASAVIHGRDVNFDLAASLDGRGTDQT
jgi:hypothetical protein